MRPAARWAVWALGVCLGACQAPQRGRPTPVVAPMVPSRPSSGAAPLGREAGAAEHYRVDAQRSQVLILVYRDGSAAMLGHNHVLAVHDLSGDIALPADDADDAGATFALEFPVAAIGIDEPMLRAAQGEAFQSQIDAAGVAGTRSHMLGTELLDAQRFTTIGLQSQGIRPEGDHWLATTRIRVRDHESEVEVPVVLERAGDELHVSGELDLTHAQLGLRPYSVAFGALRVAETMHVRYRLVAVRR